MAGKVSVRLVVQVIYRDEEKRPMMRAALETIDRHVSVDLDEMRAAADKNEYFTKVLGEFFVQAGLDTSEFIERIDESAERELQAAMDVAEKEAIQLRQLEALSQPPASC